MLHTIAFSQALGSAQSTLGAINAVPDPTLRTSGQYIYMPPLSNIVGEYKIGADISGAQLAAPSLKKLFNYDLATFDVSAAPTTPVKYQPHYLNPYLLQPNEGLQAFVTDTAGAQDTIVVELSDGVVAPVSPVNALTVKATFSGTQVAYAWSNFGLTFSQTLPVGSYDCIGARVESAGGVFARFFPVGGTYRPGVTVRQTIHDQDVPFERFGGKGVLFNFNQLTPPSIDLIGPSGSITGVVYLDLVPSGQ